MFNKQKLKEMFNFTTNKKRTITLGIFMLFQALYYQIFYQYALSKSIDKYIPEKNIKMTIIKMPIMQKY